MCFLLRAVDFNSFLKWANFKCTGTWSSTAHQNKLPSGLKRRAEWCCECSLLPLCLRPLCDQQGQYLTSTVFCRCPSFRPPKKFEVRLAPFFTNWILHYLVIIGYWRKVELHFSVPFHKFRNIEQHWPYYCRLQCTVRKEDKQTYCMTIFD